MTGKHVVVTLRSSHGNDPLSRRSITLSPDHNTLSIGRSSKSQIKKIIPAENNAWFESRVMSRNHAVLGINSTQQVVWIRDVGSMHGTAVNDSKIPSAVEVPIQSGDQITLGAEVSRGNETFAPLKLHCEYKWVEGQPDSASTASKPTNHFSVPDNEDDEDDIVIDAVSKISDSRTVVVLSDSEDMSESDSNSVPSVDVPSPTTSPVAKSDNGKPAEKAESGHVDHSQDNPDDLVQYLEVESEDEVGDSAFEVEDEEEEDDEVDDEHEDGIEEDDDEEDDEDIGDINNVEDHIIVQPDHQAGSTLDDLRDSGAEIDLDAQPPPRAMDTSGVVEDTTNLDFAAQDAGLVNSTSAFNPTGLEDVPRLPTFHLPPPIPPSRDYSTPNIFPSPSPMKPLSHPATFSTRDRWWSNASDSSDACLTWDPYDPQYSPRGNIFDFLALRRSAPAPTCGSVDIQPGRSELHMAPYPSDSPVERHTTSRSWTNVALNPQNDTQDRPPALNPQASARVSIADIVDQVPPTSDDVTPLKRKASQIEETIIESSVQCTGSADELFSTHGPVELTREEEGSSLPDAQPQAPLPDAIISASQTSALSTTPEPTPENEPTPERPRKRLRKEGSSVLRFAATALGGAIVGGATTVALLASLPPNFFS